MQKLLLIGGLVFWSIGFILAQNSPDCIAIGDQDYLTGQVNFNYGSTTNAYNKNSRANITVGQPLVGNLLGQNYKGALGFWSRFLQAPTPPEIIVTEGDLEDRIQIKWSADPLSPTPTSYKIYRDGSLLSTVDGETFSMIDFNVIAGKFYTYEVSGVNSFGEGSTNSTLGFLNPNGVVTGQIKSQNGNPVVDAIVQLTPTTGNTLYFDGSSMAFANYAPSYPRNAFTISCWVKLDEGNDTTAILDLGSTIKKNWWIHTLPQADGKGIQFGIGEGNDNTVILSHSFADSIKDEWHYIAATYNGTNLLLYDNGNLVQSAKAQIALDSMPLFLGQKPNASGRYKGWMDEIRLLDQQLSQTEIQMIQSISVAPNKQGLVNYWKFDEGVGIKSFDLTANKQKIYLCGAQWSNDLPQIMNAGMTDATGSFRIPGINYGTGNTFTATASKNFHFNQSLEFNGFNQQYATLTNFDLPDTNSIEIAFKIFDLNSEQGLLYKGHSGTTDFALFANTGELFLTIGGTTHSLTSIGMDFYRLALVMDRPDGGSNLDASVYLNGNSIGTFSYTSLPDSFSAGNPWLLGAVEIGGVKSNYLTGLIDEISIYDQHLELANIQASSNAGTDITLQSLIHHFPLNEGSGTKIKDYGKLLSGEGVLEGASFSTVTKVVKTEPHVFTPSSRLITLNPSNTSVDGIDFVDQSTIPVSGYVRFEDTDCFQEGVEILVNGTSYVPPVFTDENGYFSLDLEPGASVQLKPNFKEHTYTPAFWDINTIASPIAGVLFRNQIKRKISGQMAGNNSCRKSVIPDGAIVKVKVETLDGCFYEEQQLENPNGKFEFSNLPPLPFSVAVTQHSNNVVYEYFQLKGGVETDLTEKSDTVDFIYYSQPQIEMTSLDTNRCGVQMIEQNGTYTTEIKVFQQYDGGNCYLDTFQLNVDNMLGDPGDPLIFDTLISEGKFKYRFKAGGPNIAAPYFQTLTLKALANEKENSLSTQAVVLGKRPRETDYASTSPEIPFLILRDPPGDQSKTTFTKESTVCNNFGFSISTGLDLSNEIELDLGNKTEFSTGIGYEKITTIEIVNNVTMGMTMNLKNTISKNTELCLTANETISTGDGEVVLGDSADVYVGGALNLLFGITDELKYDSVTCSYILDTALIVFPETFASTFIYSERQIKRTIIPNLESIGDTLSANTWRGIIAKNEELKKAAIFEKNISFDGGATYESSSKIDRSATSSIEFNIDIGTTFASEVGFEIEDVGLTNKFQMAIKIGAGFTSENKVGTATTTSYLLADNDIGDAFTVDILQDPVYKTPVFRTKSGNSSCPYEPKTVPRDAMTLTVDKTIATNVPDNQQAVFNFTLGNTSQTDEFRYYTLDLWPVSNQDGAKVKIQGTELSTGSFLVDPGKSYDIKVTVERGPTEYSYEKLLINGYSQCESDRYDALSDGNFPPEPFYKGIEISAYFLEPCSPIDIGFPLQNWVHTPEDGDNLLITLNEFNRYDADLELIRVQYRRTKGDGAWINIQEVLKSELDNDVFKIVTWNTAGLQDGEYEIRAVTQCTGSQNAGISTVIAGKFEREAPAIFGTPQPSDGVLDAGDEISITFNEPIRCDLILQADLFNNNNVGLYNTQTGELIDATVTCSEDKISIVPNIPQQFIENQILRVQVDSIHDLANNSFGTTSWEFVVDQNPLRWLGQDINEIVYEGNSLVITRDIENRGGFAMDFQIEGIPDWLEVTPLEGNLSPGSGLTVTFRFDENIINGSYKDTLQLAGALGDEPLVVNIRKLCDPPLWEDEPAGFDYSMNMTLELNIEGKLSTDPMDIVGAFVDGELRGKSNVEYDPILKKHIVFISVYSNQVSGETIEFKIWDAASCLLYSNIVESFPFTLDGFIGTPLNPAVLNTNNLVQRDIALMPGWNWISFSLNVPDNSIDNVLNSLSNPTGGLIKDQTSFSQFSSGLGQWLGSLPNLGYTSMYQYNSGSRDTIHLIGEIIQPETVTIPISVGWNWISYLPNTALTPNEALSSLTPLNNDIIKSRTEFSQFVAGVGWIGNLDFLNYPNGYMLKISNPGVLQYPPNVPLNAPTGILDENTYAVVSPRNNGIWTVQPEKFEYTMNLIGWMDTEDQILGTGDVIAAFADNEVRGSSEVVYVPDLDQWLVFLTIYGQHEQESLNFKWYDASEEAIHKFQENLNFEINTVVGNADEPFGFTLGTTTHTKFQETLNKWEVYPNPAKDVLNINFHSNRQEQLQWKMYNSLGQLIFQQNETVAEGYHLTQFSLKGIPNGAYFMQVTSSEGIEKKKFLIQK